MLNPIQQIRTVRHRRFISVRPERTNYLTFFSDPISGGSISAELKTVEADGKQRLVALLSGTITRARRGFTNEGKSRFIRLSGSLLAGVDIQLVEAILEYRDTSGSAQQLGLFRRQQLQRPVLRRLKRRIESPEELPRGGGPDDGLDQIFYSDDSFEEPTIATQITLGEVPEAETLIIAVPDTPAAGVAVEQPVNPLTGVAPLIAFKPDGSVTEVGTREDGSREVTITDPAFQNTGLLVNYTPPLAE